MNIEQARQHIIDWVEYKLSVPSPQFNNFPPCPYSRNALLRNKVDIRVGDGAELLDLLASIAHTWDDSFEMIMVVCEKQTITPEALIAGTTKLNELLEPDDLMTNFDHPDSTHPRYKVISTNGKYVVGIVQRLNNFVEASKPLFAGGYFKNVADEHLTDYPSYKGNTHLIEEKGADNKFLLKKQPPVN